MKITILTGNRIRTFTCEMKPGRLLRFWDTFGDIVMRFFWVVVCTILAAENLSGAIKEEVAGHHGWAFLAALGCILYLVWTLHHLRKLREEAEA